MEERKEGLYFDGRHYDRRVKFNDDVPFWIDVAEKYGEPILEMACGTGRLTIPLAQRGHLISGLDKSESMLKEAKRKSRQVNVDIEWIYGDARDFYLNKKFALIFIPFNSLSELHSLEEIELFFYCVRRHLRSDGRFIIDIFNPDFSFFVRDKEKRYAHSEYESPDGEGKITVTENNVYDDALQVNRIKLYHQYPDGREMVDDLNMRIFFPQEIDALLKYNGFKIERKYGNYDMSVFKAGSPKQLIVSVL